VKEGGLINKTVKSNKEYIIPFVGLSLGSHKFEFDVTDAFFDGIEYSIIHKGNVRVELLLEKRETMLVGNYKINGTVETNCNRCNDPVETKVKGEYRLVYKFGTEPSDDESLIIVYPEQFEIDIRDDIFELITVSLPLRSVHKKGECNEEMIEILGEYILTKEKVVKKESDENDDSDDDDNEGIDPRWAALNKLK
jgi:uncharacterized protein